MKKCVSLIAVALVVFGLTGITLSREKTSAAKREPRRHRHGPEAVRELLESFELGEDDIARVKQMFDTHKQAAANWKREHGDEFREAREAMQKAKKDQGAEAVKSAHERMKKLMESRKEAGENLFVQLGEVLSKEQLARVKALMGGPKRSGEHGSGGSRARILNAALEMLDLDERKKAAIKDIQAAANVEFEKLKTAMRQAKTRKEKAKIRDAFGQAHRKSWDKIKAVLGEDLTAKLHGIVREMSLRISRRGDLLSKLDFTDEQKRKITEIRRAAGEKMKEADDWDARRAVITEMRKKIEAVLTDDQRARLRKAISKRRKRERKKAEK